jgi:hypothetical protein
MTISRCMCGKRKSRNWDRCISCQTFESRKRIAEVKAIVTSGKCPDCGTGLRRNLALTGWWQCSQYGAEGFRTDSSKPSCSWQGFTS